MKCHVVNVAKSATLAIYEYAQMIQTDKPIAAAQWLERLWDQIRSLETFPHRNPVSEQESRPLGFEVRKIPFGNYLPLYRIDEDKERVEVIRFRHAARLPEGILEPDLDSDD